MIGVAVTGERKWHASWWEWHGLIVAAYVIVGLAARREWRDERFRRLYLPTTRARHQQVSVLFADLVDFTAFAERSSPAQVAAVLDAYWRTAAPLITREFGGEVEKFIGDALMATFNNRGDQPDHAVRAAGAALELQRRLSAVSEPHPSWPRVRVGVNSGDVIVREIGSHGHVAYPSVGDTVNTGARLESAAPSGGVLIGDETYRRLPDRVGRRVAGRASREGQGGAHRRVPPAGVALAEPAVLGRCSRGVARSTRRPGRDESRPRVPPQPWTSQSTSPRPSPRSRRRARSRPEGCGRVEDDRMWRVPRRAADAVGGRVVEEHLIPRVAELPRDRARDLEGARRIRIGAVQNPRARRLRGDLDQRGDVRGRGRVVHARASMGEEDHGAPSRTRLTKTHSRGERDPGPWILDGLSTVTGQPLSSRTCSATPC